MGRATEGAVRWPGGGPIEKDLDDVSASLFDQANTMAVEGRPIAYLRVVRVSQPTPAVVSTLPSQPFTACLMNEDSYVIRPTFQVLWLI